MNLLSKKFLGNSIIIWIIILLLCPIGTYIVIIKHDAKGFYFLILMSVLMFIFENIIFKKMDKKNIKKP